MTLNRARLRVHLKAEERLVAVLLVAVVGALLAYARAGSTMKPSSSFATDAGSPFTSGTPEGRELAKQREREAIAAVLLLLRRTQDRRLDSDERAANLDPDLVDAILRMEGMFDPTRVGLFGPALRMELTAGTMSMNNVFGDRWNQTSLDPNIQFRVHYLAEFWLRRAPIDCDGFRKVRPNESESGFDGLTPGECRNLENDSRHIHDAFRDAPIVSGTLSMPAFVAPYPGNRLSSEAMRSAQEARINALRERRLFLQPGAPSESDRPASKPRARRSRRNLAEDRAIRSSNSLRVS